MSAWSYENMKSNFLLALNSSAVRKRERTPMFWRDISLPFPQSEKNAPDKQKELCFRLNLSRQGKQRSTWILESFLEHAWRLCVVACAHSLLPLTKRLWCHCLSWMLGTCRLFDSRTRYTLEICHWPRFFHELSVPKGNATYNAENKHGGRVLSKRKRQDVPNLTDS